MNIFLIDFKICFKETFKNFPFEKEYLCCGVDKKEKREKRKEFAIKEHVRVEEEENRSYVFRELVEKREQAGW